MSENLKEILKKKVEEKAKRYEENGAADTDFEKKIDEKTKIHMWLPSSVFEQQRMVSLASLIFQDALSSVEEILAIKEQYARMVLKHTKLNGQIQDPDKYSIADLEAYPLLYWAELLSPLLLWGEQRAEKLLLLL